MKIEDLKEKFEKVCVNASSAYTVNCDGRKKCVQYRRDDFAAWAKEAMERGEKYFYHEPVDPKDPYGKHRLCEPKYVYRMQSDLSVKEYKSLFEDQTN